MIDERKQRWFPVLNRTGETIPAYAIMRIQVATALPGGQIVLDVHKPDHRSEWAQDLDKHCFNGPRPIPPGKRGDATLDFPARVLVERVDDPDAATHHYGLMYGEWFCTNRVRMWRSIPAISAITHVVGDDVPTILAMPTVFRPSIPPLVVNFLRETTLTTSFADVPFTHTNGPGLTIGAEFDVSNRVTGYQWGWSFGWNLDDIEHCARYGLVYRPSRLRAVEDMTYRAAIHVRVASEYVNPEEEEEGVREITVALFRNGVQTELSIFAQSVTSSTYGDSLLELELSEGDEINVRAKMSEASDDPVEVRGLIVLAPAADQPVDE